MSVESIRKCDIYGVRRDVKRYRVEITEIGSDDPDGALVYMEEADMGVRGLDRLRRSVADGMAPPNKRGRKAADDGAGTEPLFVAGPCELCAGTGKLVGGATCEDCAGSGTTIPF